jgi:hypothetical protein
MKQKIEGGKKSRPVLSKKKASDWEERFETAYYDSNPDTTCGEWYPIFDDVLKAVRKEIAKAKQEGYWEGVMVMEKEIDRAESEMIARAKAEAVRECVEALPKQVLVGGDSDYLEGCNYGYNQAIDQAKDNLLKVVKEK